MLVTILASSIAESVVSVDLCSIFGKAQAVTMERVLINDDILQIVLLVHKEGRLLVVSSV